MRVAVPFWHERVSPVLDTAGNFLVVDIRNGSVADALRVNLADSSFSDRIEYLKRSGCSTLLCGAVSENCLRIVAAKGLTVVPWLRGNVEQIINAFVADGLGGIEFTMPGCGRHGRQRRRGRRRIKSGRRRRLC